MNKKIGTINLILSLLIINLLIQYSFSQPKYNFYIGTLQQQCLIQCFYNWYAYGTSQSDYNACASTTYFLAGAVHTNNREYMVVGAFGKSSEVLTVNTGQNQVVTSLGTYWYNNPGASFGFSNVPYLNQRSADTYDCDAGLSYCTNSYAMSWHAGGGGWRAGTVMWLNSDYTYIKALFKLVDSYYCQQMAGLNPLVCAQQCESCANTPSNCQSCASNSYRVNPPTCSCPSGYYDANQKVCGKCDYKCATCSNVNSCQSCQDSAHRVGGSCICIDGFYDSGSPSCSQCMQTCKTCNSGSTCLSCPDNSKRTLKNNLCVCNDGYYDNGQCQSCMAKCKTCNAAATCLTCPDNANRAGNTCDCITGYFDNQGTCQSCMKNCRSCTVVDKCTSCRDGSNRSGDLCQCSDGYFENKDGICQKCSSSCVTCSGQANNCLKCNLVGTNRIEPIPSCPCNSGFFDTGDFVCNACHQSCSTCDGLTDKNCLTCKQNLFKKNEKECVDANNCGTGWYPDKDSGKCLACHSSCVSCNGPNSFNCLSCLSGQFLDPETNACLSCFAGKCITCQNKSTNCLKCNVDNTFRTNVTPTCNCLDGYYESNDLKCLECHRTCNTCKGQKSSECLSCRGNLYLQDQQCVAQCGQNFYQDAVQHKCLACHESCVGCSGPSAKECIKCLPNFFLDVDKKCQKCSSKCKNCETIAIKCLECNLLNTYRKNNAPLCDCGDGLYENQEMLCEYCHEDCLTCNGPNSTQCLSCHSDKFMYNKTCLSECPLTFYANQESKQCSKCNVACENCNGASSENCTSCADNSFRITRSCVCQNGYFDVGEKQCSKCAKQCSACYGIATNCTIPEPIGDCAIIYENCDFQGRFYQVCESLPQVEFDAKSFYIPPRKKLTLFNLKGFEGQSALFTKTVSCLENVEYDFLEVNGIKLLEKQNNQQQSGINNQNSNNHQSKFMNLKRNKKVNKITKIQLLNE